MYYVYVIQNKINKKIYIGYTRDLKRRMKEHYHRIILGNTQGKDWELVYYEAFRSKIDAQHREQKLKDHGQSKRWLKERLKHSLE